MVYFVIRYRREKHPKPADIEGSTWLEITWTIIPTLDRSHHVLLRADGLRILEEGSSWGNGSQGDRPPVVLALSV